MMKKILINSKYNEQEVKEAYHQARIFREILKSALQKEVESQQGALKSNEIYEEGLAKIADRLGQIKAIERILKIICDI